MKAIHITELRSNLDAARSSLGLAAISYTDPSLAAGTAIKAAYIQTHSVKIGLPGTVADVSFRARK